MRGHRPLFVEECRMVTSVFLCACESWTLTAELQRIIVLPHDATHLIQRLLPTRKSSNQTTHRPPELVKRRKLQWYGHVSRSSGLAKTILQGTVKGGRRQGRQRKRWEDNIREWTGLEFAKSQRAVENRKKMEETGCEIICGAPTTLKVKG